MATEYKGHNAYESHSEAFGAAESTERCIKDANLSSRMKIKIYRKNIHVGRHSLGLPRPDLRFENGSFSGAFSDATGLNVGRKIHETKMAATG
jgi:hypothetical protein